MDCPAESDHPFYLRKKIAERFEGLKVEVLNFGFSSYSPIIEQVVYRQLMRRLKADWVIQLYDPFDPQDDVLYSNYARYDEKGEIAAIPEENTITRDSGAPRWCVFIQFAYQTAKNGGEYLTPEQRWSSRVLYVLNPTIFQPVIDYSFSIVKHLANEIQNDGSHLLIFQYPWVHFLKDQHEYEEYLKPSPWTPTGSVQPKTSSRPWFWTSARRTVSPVMTSARKYAKWRTSWDRTDRALRYIIMKMDTSPDRPTSVSRNSF